MLCGGAISVNTAGRAPHVHGRRRIVLKISLDSFTLTDLGESDAH